MITGEPAGRAESPTSMHSVEHGATALLTVTPYAVPPDTTVIAVLGDVDLCTGPLLLDTLLAHVRPLGPQLVIDLTDVSFFGSTGLTVLMTVRHEAEEAGVRLSVVADKRPVLLPIQITGLHRVLDLHPDLNRALETRPGPAA